MISRVILVKLFFNNFAGSGSILTVGKFYLLLQLWIKFSVQIYDCSLNPYDIVIIRWKDSIYRRKNVYEPLYTHTVKINKITLLLDVVREILTKEIK